MAHACGGRARCSTCRIWVAAEGVSALPEPTAAETALKDRIGLGPEIRLACQLRPRAPMTFRRLVIDDADLALANQLDHRHVVKAGEVRRVAVLFFDVAGFTAISDRIPPYDVMFLLNKLWTRVERILERHGGYFDKAIGDGFMAIFGVVDQPDICLRAVAAALDVLRTVDAARPILQELYDVEFDARIGVHFGETLVGALGPAGDERLTVVGEVANIASRVEAANKEAGTRLLVTQDLYDHVRDDVVAPDFVRLRVPGVAARMTLYEITGLTDTGRARLLDTTRRPASRSPYLTWTRLCDAADLAEGEEKGAQDHSDTQVVMLARSGRGRSGGALRSVPICTKPAMRSFSASPRPLVQKSRSWLTQPESQLAPQPAASAAFSSDRHTAPVE